MLTREGKKNYLNDHRRRHQKQNEEQIQKDNKLKPLRLAGGVQFSQLVPKKKHEEISRQKLLTDYFVREKECGKEVEKEDLTHMGESTSSESSSSVSFVFNFTASSLFNAFFLISLFRLFNNLPFSHICFTCSTNARRRQPCTRLAELSCFLGIITDCSLLCSSQRQDRHRKQTRLYNAHSWNEVGSVILKSARNPSLREKLDPGAQMCADRSNFTETGSVITGVRPRKQRR